MAPLGNRAACVVVNFGHELSTLPALTLLDALLNPDIIVAGVTLLAVCLVIALKAVLNLTYLAFSVSIHEMALGAGRALREISADLALSKLAFLANAFLEEVVELAFLAFARFAV